MPLDEKIVMINEMKSNFHLIVFKYYHFENKICHWSISHAVMIANKDSNINSQIEISMMRGMLGLRLYHYHLSPNYLPFHLHHPPPSPPSFILLLKMHPPSSTLQLQLHLAFSRPWRRVREPAQSDDWHARSVGGLLSWALRSHERHSAAFRSHRGFSALSLSLSYRARPPARRLEVRPMTASSVMVAKMYAWRRKMCRCHWEESISLLRYLWSILRVGIASQHELTLGNIRLSRNRVVFMIPSTHILLL